MASIFLNHIPIGTKNRHLRRKVGQAIRKVCQSDSIDPLPRFHLEIWNTRKECNGRISIGSFPVAKKLLDQFKTHPLRVVGGTIYADWDRKSNVERLRFVTDPVAQPDPVSDYDSEIADPFQSDQIPFARITCGVWRVDGSYAEAWSFQACKNGYQSEEGPVMRIEHDTAHLLIDIDHRKVRMLLSDIEGYILNRTSPGHCYITLRALPTFLEEIPDTDPSSSPTYRPRRQPKQKAKPSLRRLAALSKEHEHVAPFCWVYTIEGVNPKQCDIFFKNNSSRLAKPADMRPVRNMGPRPFLSKTLEKLTGWFSTLEFPLAFQLEAMLYNRFILPEELSQMQLEVELLLTKYGEKAVADAIRSLCPFIPYRTALVDPDKSSRCDVTQLKQRLRNHLRASTSLRVIRRNRSPPIEVHCITVTPAGIYYNGPRIDEGNRLIRQYPGHETNYLRVRFSDESQGHLNFDPTVDSRTEILQKRFKRMLDQGIKVGGRHFDFLAFSNSALRHHSTWFVLSSFHVDGKLVTAESIRGSVGFLSHIRCPPRWAARLGQSLTTASTALIVPVEAIKEDLPDTKRNGHCFSDGVGTISAQVVRKITANRSEALEGGPVVFQIRIGGAKGVLSLDPRLEGYKIRLRPSQIKFRHPADVKELTLEVVAACTSASPFYLNRPIVMLLESLGTPAQAFCDLQKKAVGALQNVMTSPSDAVRALDRYHLGQATKLGQILKSLDGPLMGLDKLNAMRRIPFLRHCVVAAITYALRAIKYHCRIFVPDSCTVMGIMDETETLEEGEIYVCLRSSNGKRKVVEGKCLVARSPTMHPGDVQIAHAIGEVEETHPLRALHNCIVFSSKGRRPLQTMLAGGDLDGDLYNVSQYEPIMPRKTYQSGAYPIATSKVLPRDVEISDVVDFFLDFIESDQLGKIATMHLVEADRSRVGVLDQVCVELAELHSTAVDMAKTGVKPDLNKLSRFIDTGTKPDFMQKEFRIEPDVPNFALTHSEARQQSRRPQYWRERDGFYRSEKALGQLFRQIDVSADLAKWQSRVRLEGDERFGSVNEWADPIKRALSRYLKVGSVNLWTTEVGSGHHDLLKDYYIELDSLARDFAPEDRSQFLTEEEVFVGVVIGRGPHMQHSRTFDMMSSLRLECQTLIKRVLEVVVASDDWEEDTDDGPVKNAASAAPKLQDKGDVEKRGPDTNKTIDGTWEDILDGEREQVLVISEEVPPLERFKRLAAFFTSAVNYQAANPSRRSAPWIVMPELLRTMEVLSEGA